MTQKLRKDDKVTWNSGQGKATGVIEAHITEPTTVDGQKVDASEEDPRYLVRNDNTGKVTGHKPGSLSKANEASEKLQKESSNAASGSDDFARGDRVKWNTAQGKTTGRVIKKLTSSTTIKGHTAQASEAEPQYLVESEQTGAQAAHKPESLTKIS